MTKYYYTCPIKAGYMAEYFGVKMSYLFCDADSWQEYKSTERMRAFKLKDYFSDSRATLDGKIWVDEEWNSFFEPKEGDKGEERNLHSIEPCYFGGKYWAYENEVFQKPPHQQRVNIIMRDGEQFFMPEVEND
ncbi:MAG: hypothetical protein FJ368_07155 [Pelagibacterales bacterium]|nr:hypothetical protein [Pelagibacterales bacterium]